MNLPSEALIGKKVWLGSREEGILFRKLLAAKSFN